ncbi:MAG: cysteine desulfurase family protein [Termitinemataceae bacterium]|nr:MAG: cysteine desulfurase family protein [Termitinemataceae bacterium]
MRYYFDWAATAPYQYKADNIEQETRQNDLIAHAFEEKAFFANPSSLHEEGRIAKAALEEARKRAADLLDVQPEQLYWTSGASESNAIVLFSLPLKNSAARGLLFGAAEHPSIRENAAVLNKLGIQTAQVPTESYGAPCVKTLQKSLEKHPETALITIMHVNNETGAIAPIEELVRSARNTAKRPLHFHADMVQSPGKTPFSLKEFDVDSASFSAHKTGGPRGIGLLYLKKPLIPLVSGGGQERGIRSGTENPLGALKFCAALEDSLKKTAGKDPCAGEAAAQALFKGLLSIERCVIVPQERCAEDKRFSPYIVQAAFKGIAGETLCRMLDDAGFAASTGSACSSAEKKRPVLEAMGVDSKTAFEAIRLSTGWSTSISDVEALLDALRNICAVI